MYHDASTPAAPAVIDAARQAVLRAEGREALAEIDALVASGHFAWMTERRSTRDAVLQATGWAVLECGEAAVIVQFGDPVWVAFNGSSEYWRKARRLARPQQAPAAGGRRWRR